MSAVEWKPLIEKIVFVLMLAASMSLAGYVTSGVYQTEPFPYLPQPLSLSISSGSAPLNCNLSSSIPNSNVSVLPSGQSIKFDYQLNTVVRCLSDASTLQISVVLPTSASDEGHEHNYVRSPVDLYPGYNLIQLFSHYQADDDDVSSSELLDAMLINTFIPGEPGNAQFLVHLQAPLASTHQWWIDSSGVASSVIAFLCLGFAGLFTFVLWFLVWRQGGQAYTTV